MSFIPYSKQYIDKDDIDLVVSCLNSPWLTQGPLVQDFENAIAKSVDANYAVAVSSGTAALHLSCLALGISNEDEVITSSNTFVASSNSILYSKGVPKFADIDVNTGLINVDSIKRCITSKTKAIMPVDFAGSPADMNAIYNLAKQNNLKIIQDSSHSLGATYKSTKVGCGKFSDLTVFSFHPVKPMTTGEGGAITTNDKQLYLKLCELRTHGITKDVAKLSQNPGPWYYEMQDLGFNYRMTDIQAALGISQLKKLSKFMESRQEIVDYYHETFKSNEFITPLSTHKDVCSGNHLFVILIDFETNKISRKELMENLKKEGIGTQVHYIPVYKQPYYQNLGYSSVGLEQTDLYYQKALSIPLFPFMSKKDCDKVVNSLNKYLC